MSGYDDSLQLLTAPVAAANSRGIVTRWWFIHCVVAVASLLLVAPTLVRPVWGLLDDPDILTNSKEYPHWQYEPDTAAGRYRPVYWAWYRAQYLAFGLDVRGYAGVQAGIFVATNMLLVGILRRMRVGSGVAAGAVVVFSFSTPVAENFFTLCKPEPLQLALILSSIWLMLRAEEGDRLRRAMFWIGSGVAVLGAQLVKEATGILLLAACGWLVVAVVLRRPAGNALRWVIVNVVVVGMFGAMAYGVDGVRPPWAGHYTSGSMETLGAGAVLKYYAQQDADVLAMVVLAAAGALVCYVRRRQGGEGVALMAAGFAGAVVVFYVLVWRRVGSYYFLPVSAAAVVAGAASVGRLGNWLRRAAGVAGIAILAYAVPRAVSSASALRDWMQINGNLAKLVLGQSRGTVALLNYPPDAEYLHQLRQWANLNGRDDLVIGSARSARDWLKADAGSLLLVNEGRPGNELAIGRALAPPPAATSLAWLENLQRGARLEAAGQLERQHRIFGAFALDGTKFRLRWRILRITQPPQFLVERGMDDKWMGREAKLWVRRGGGKVLRISGSAMKTKTPEVIGVRAVCEGRAVGEVSVASGGTFAWKIEMPEVVNGSSPWVEINLAADSTYSPREEGMGDDPRRLSVTIEDTALE